MISLKTVNKKIEIVHISPILVTDLNCEHARATAFFLCTPLRHRSHIIWRTEQARVTGDVQTDMSGIVLVAVV